MLRNHSYIKWVSYDPTLFIIFCGSHEIFMGFWTNQSIREYRKHAEEYSQEFIYLNSSILSVLINTLDFFLILNQDILIEENNYLQSIQDFSWIRTKQPAGSQLSANQTPGFPPLRNLVMLHCKRDSSWQKCEFFFIKYLSISSNKMNTHTHL